MPKNLATEKISLFQKKIYNFYTKNKRSFSWRKTTDPYKILVSEIMLQQTQTKRVEKKYQEFIKVFPNFKKLAESSLHTILKVWQGMGYNRRALYLHQIAILVIENYNGKLPAEEKILQTFKGIGKNTAASICAFAFNAPTVFIETNIRSVYINYFFKNKKRVTDEQILNLVKQTLDYKNPREWYYALMDYGVFLKKQFKNLNLQSAHYIKQTAFEGSDRQIRGKILKLLTEKNSISLTHIFKELKQFNKQRIKKILTKLVEEKFLILEKIPSKYILNSL